MTLGDYVSRAMEERNLIAAEVARRSKGSLTANYVSKVMHGDVQNPSIPKLKALAKAIGIKENDLLRVAGVEFDKEESPWPPETIVRLLQRMISEPELGELVKLAMSKKPEEIKRVIKALTR